MKNNIQAYLYAIYCVGLVTMNILAAKQTDILFFTINLGLFISPLVFIVNDIQSEVFGYKQATNMIFTGLVVNISAALIYAFALNMPSSKQYLNQEAFEAVLGSTFRITLASIIAYFIGSIVNAKVMDYLKKKHGKYLFVRAITSTFVGQNLDNAIFMTLAFVGVLPVSSIITMIIGGTVIEVLYEIMLYPLTKTCIKKIKGYR